HWGTRERARPARAPTAAGVTAAAPSLTRMSIAAPISASRCWARCSATVEAVIFGMRGGLLEGWSGPGMRCRSAAPSGQAAVDHLVHPVGSVHYRRVVGDHDGGR